MLHQLRCFVMLTQTLHYTEAARQLYISQPSLSYAINSLENELGVKLFEKKGKSITLTVYADELLPFALTAIHSVDAGLLKLKEMKNPKNIRLGYIYSLAYDFLPGVFGVLPSLSENDSFTFSFFQGQSEDLIRRIKEEKLDFAFCPYYETDGISSAPVIPQEVFLVLPNAHHLSTKSTIKISDLKDENIAMISKGTNLRTIIDEMFLSHDITPNIMFEAEECNSLASFVASKFGISFFPKIPTLEGYNLVYRKIEQNPIQRMVYLVWKTDGNMSKLSEIFTTKLQKLFDKTLSTDK